MNQISKKKTLSVLYPLQPPSDQYIIKIGLGIKE
jgi:hypothetical protein